MKNYNEYLQKEAEYQDLKIAKNPRAHLNVLYNDVSTKHRDECRKEAIGDLYQKKVLDLGCGDGFASMEALRLGAYVTAIDISPKSIEYLVALAEKENLHNRLDARVMDAHQLEFEDETFDVVFGNGILHHLPMLEKAVKEIKRVLKPFGYAVFTEPLGMNPFINLFRKSTPNCRTSEEKPFTMKEISIIKNNFPTTQFYFFEYTTLVTKAMHLLKLHGLANKLQKFLIKVDKKLLAGNKKSKITFFQKMSWLMVIKMVK